MMEQDGHVTVIWQPEEDERRCKILERFFEKEMSEIYHDALDAYYTSFINDEDVWRLKAKQ